MTMKKQAQRLRAQGRGKDTELVHLTKNEVRAMQGLAQAAGGQLTRNPTTGLPEAGFLESMLPTILGVAANFIVPGSGMIVGGLTGAMQNKNDPLLGAALGAMGGYGGGQLAAGLQGVASAAPGAAASAIQNPALTAAVGTEAGSQAAMLASQNAGFGLEGAQMLAQAAGGNAPTAAQFAGMGLGETMANPGAFVEQMGGFVPTAKAVGQAAAPMIYQSMMPGGGSGGGEGGSMPDYEYDAGYTGGEMTGPDVSSERRWFNPEFKRMAEGGIVQGYFAGGMARRHLAAGGPGMQTMSGFTRVPEGTGGGFFGGAPAPAQVQARNRTGTPGFTFNPQSGSFARRMEAAPPAAPPTTSQRRLGRARGDFAEGGVVEMESGGFVVPADVVSMAGGGSTDAGLGALAKTIGARPIKGAGDGMSDDIPARIDGRPVARVANGEAYVPKKTVHKLGGAKRLYKTMDNIREQAHGKRQQQRPVDLKKAMS